MSDSADLEQTYTEKYLHSYTLISLSQRQSRALTYQANYTKVSYRVTGILS